MILDGDLLLPEMQRKYVWPSTKVRDLLDSVYRDYPSGSILMWETDNLPETRESAVKGDKEYGLTQKLLLLDGQQRLTSLATIMSGHPIRLRIGKDNIVEKHLELYFNVDHPDKPILDVDSSDFDIESKELKNQFFQIKNSAIANQSNWISVTKLFTQGTGEILREMRLGYEDPKYKKVYDRLFQLYSRRENYIYPVQILDRSISYPEATQVFIRVNSAGTRLSGSDLALAQVTSRWSGSMALIETFANKCEKANFIVDAGFLLRCVMSIETGQSRFSRISKIPIRQIKESWEKTKQGFEFVINFVRQNAQIATSAAIPSPYLYIPLLVYAVNHDLCLDNQDRNFLRWFYAAGMWGHYARGSSESILDKDLSVLKVENASELLMNNLINQIGRIDVTDEDLEGKSTNSPFFNMISYVMAVRNRAEDWGTGITLNLANIGQAHKIQHDHIFPKTKLTKLLKEKYSGEDGEAKVKKLVNDMANIAFLSQRENPRKSDRTPKIYLKRIKNKFGEKALTSQYIPLDENLWEMNNYEDFLIARRKLLVVGINKLMDELSREPTQQETIHEALLQEERAKAEKVLSENKIHKLGNEIIILLGDCNKISDSNVGKAIFKTTNTLIQKLGILGTPVNKTNTFGSLIDALFEVFYEGSGDLERIPENFKRDDLVIFTIKHIRNDLRHDLEHGNIREIAAKKLRLKKIYQQYSGKPVFTTLTSDDFLKIQLQILEKLKTFLSELKLICAIQPELSDNLN